MTAFVLKHIPVVFGKYFANWLKVYLRRATLLHFPEYEFKRNCFASYFSHLYHLPVSSAKFDVQYIVVLVLSFGFIAKIACCNALGRRGLYRIGDIGTVQISIPDQQFESIYHLAAEMLGKTLFGLPFPYKCQVDLFNVVSILRVLVLQHKFANLLLRADQYFKVVSLLHLFENR